MPHVLIVDDDVNTREALVEITAAEGFTTAMAGSIHDAQLQILRRRPDVVLVDIKITDGSVMDIINDIEARVKTEIIHITAHAILQNAMR